MRPNLDRSEGRGPEGGGGGFGGAGGAVLEEQVVAVLEALVQVEERQVERNWSLDSWNRTKMVTVS